MADALNPCTRCGACCADRRVVFHASESDDQPGGFVPEWLHGEVTDSLRCMEGTDRAPPRCVALRGEIGGEVRCAIYEWRPSPCRDYAPHGVAGIANHECNWARERHGLPPLPDPAVPGSSPEGGADRQHR
jgi:Fe-S-cluster containining protein